MTPITDKSDKIDGGSENHFKIGDVFDKRERIRVSRTTDCGLCKMEKMLREIIKLFDRSRGN